MAICKKCQDVPDDRGAQCDDCSSPDCHYSCKVYGNERLEPLLYEDCGYAKIYHAFYKGVGTERDRMRKIEDAYNSVHSTDPMLQLVRMPRNQYEWALIPESLRKKAACPYPASGLPFGVAMKDPSVVKRHVCIMCHGDIPKDIITVDKLECPQCFYPGVKMCIGGCDQDE